MCKCDFVAIKNSSTKLTVPYYEGSGIVHGSIFLDADFPYVAIERIVNDKALISYDDIDNHRTKTYVNLEDIYCLPKDILFRCMEKEAFKELSKHFPIASIYYEKGVYVLSSFYMQDSDYIPDPFVEKVHTLSTAKEVLKVLSTYLLRNNERKTRVYNGDPMSLLNY